MGIIAAYTLRVISINRQVWRLSNFRRLSPTGKLHMHAHHLDDIRKQPTIIGRPRVMVVDDDPIIGCVLAGALNRGGYDVEIFHSGNEALEKFEHTEADMLVVDWIMPGLDGLSLIDTLKDKYPTLPAMLITSYGSHEAVKEASASGRVDAVLAKPFDLTKFLRTVSALLTDDAVNPCASLGKSIISSDSGSHLQSLIALEGCGSYQEKILESIIDAVIMLDKRGRIIFYNRGADRMFGFKHRNLPELHLSDICPDSSRLKETIQLYFSAHPPVEEQSEVFFQKLDGENFYTIYSISLLDTVDNEKAVVLVIKDINEHHIIEKQISERARNLELLAITDPLTGIYNRRHFDRRLTEEFKRLERYNSPLSLIMLDFDRFKLINDFFGHLVGDEVLITAAKSLADGLRDVDVLARWGGEEFMILLPETGAETGLAVAKRLHAMIGSCPKWAEICPDMQVSVSMGLVSLPWLTRESSLTAVLEALDQALYRAKDSGRNCIVHFRDTIGDFQTIK